MKPVDTLKHQKYGFWLRVSAEGGSSAIFGPYFLDVGCTSTSVHLFQSPDFDAEGRTKFMGESGANAYVLIPPYLDPPRPYCIHTSSIAVNSLDGVSPNSNFKNCASQPCTSFGLVSTDDTGSYKFKILSTFTGGH